MKLIDALDVNKHIEKLLNKQEFLAVTIYLNTFKRWEDNEKSKIILKNKLTKVGEELARDGMRRPDIDSLLSDVVDLENDSEFWQNTNKGIVFFVSKDTSIALRLNESTNSKHYVGRHFNIRALSKYLFEKEEYYILVISPKNSQIYKAQNSEYSLLSGSEYLPDGVEDAPWEVDYEKSIQHHTTKSVGKGTSGGMNFHGHGAYKTGKDTLITNYLKRVDNSVNDITKEYELPMILVCSPTIYSMYMGINSYPNLLDDYVSGNPEGSIKMLLRDAWDIMRADLHTKKESLLNDARNSKHLITDLHKILRSAYYGQIDTLFIFTRKEIWGIYDKESDTVRVDKRKRKDSKDLINIATILTINNGGKVFNMFDNGSSKMEAMLRY